MKTCKHVNKIGSHCFGHGQSCPYYNKYYWCQAYCKLDKYIRWLFTLAIFFTICVIVLFALGFR